MKRIITIAIALIAAFTMSGCAALSAFGESVNAAFQGRPGTMTTYDDNGQVMDKVEANSFHVERDSKFDTTNSDGTSKNDSSVMSITVGGKPVSHVGSTLIFAQTGINEVFRPGGGTVAFRNTDPSVPFLNHFIEANRNLWKGGAKTVFVRSQTGAPIAIYAGNEVEVFSTDVPKSTFFRIDGKYLFVYRAAIDVYDTSLLNNSTPLK